MTMAVLFSKSSFTPEENQIKRTDQILNLEIVTLILLLHVFSFAMQLHVYTNSSKVALYLFSSKQNVFKADRIIVKAAQSWNVYPALTQSILFFLTHFVYVTNTTVQS